MASTVVEKLCVYMVLVNAPLSVVCFHVSPVSVVYFLAIFIVGHFLKSSTVSNASMIRPCPTCYSCISMY